MEILKYTKEWASYLIDSDDDKEFSFDFKVYKVIEWDEDLDPIKKELFFSGQIQWNGCSDIMFDSIHFCSYSDIQEFKDVIDAVWDKAEKEIMNYV